MVTAAQVKQFINTIAPIAVKVCKERGYGNAQAWSVHLMSLHLLMQL